MKTNYKLILGIITISFYGTVFSEENKVTSKLILIGDLLWEVKHERNGGIVWEEAITFCAQKGMRLPSKQELLTCQDELSKLEDDADIYLKDRPGRYYGIHRKYWSSTEDEKNPSQAWSVDIRHSPQFQSSSFSIRKSYKYLNVRCVKNLDKR